MSDFLRVPCAEWAEQLVKPVKDLSLPEYEALCAHLDNCTVCALARMDFQMIERLLRELPVPECSSEPSDALPARLEQFWNEEQEKTEQDNSTTGQATPLSPFTPSVEAAAFLGENGFALSMDEHKALTAKLKDALYPKEKSFDSELNNADKKEEYRIKLCPLAKGEDDMDSFSETVQIMLKAVLLQGDINCSVQQGEIPPQTLLEGRMPWDSLDALFAWLRPIVGEDTSSIEYRRVLRELLETYEQAKKSDFTCHQWYYESRKLPKRPKAKTRKNIYP